MTIEEKVSSAILQKDVAELEINGKTYPIAAPSISTLILVSEIVSTLPVVEKTDDPNVKVASVLRYAKDYKALGDIIAVLILGRNGLKEEREIIETVTICHGLIKRKVKHTITVDRKAELSQQIIDNVRPSVALELIVNRLRDMEVSDFFSLTTSLSEANLLKRTTEVG